MILKLKPQLTCSISVAFAMSFKTDFRGDSLALFPSAW